MKILVLAGGYSSERNVSLSSGAMVASALRGKGHQVALVDSYLGVEDDQNNLELLFEKEIDQEWTKISTETPDLVQLKKEHPQNKNGMVGKHVLELCQQVDVVFLALHGGSGEDGRLQAMLDIMGIHYTGSDYVGSALAMNKDRAKTIAEKAGVKVPAWTVRTVSKEQIEDVCNQTELPVVVKIPDGGSSIGVYIAHTKEELKEILQKTIGEKLIFEQFIEGREVQMAFLDDRVLPSIEIVVNEGFYDYANKYQPGYAIEKTPADITEEQEKQMGEMLMRVVNALELKVYSRADFIIDANGEIWFIEINTLPGLTKTSLFPQEAAAVGISFADVCEFIAKKALEQKVGNE